MCGGVPVSCCPRACGALQTVCGNQHRNVFGIELVSDTAAVARPEMVVVDLEEGLNLAQAMARHLSINRSILRQNGRLGRTCDELGRQTIAIVGSNHERWQKFREKRLLE